jgi:hypothetical protein
MKKMETIFKKNNVKEILLNFYIGLQYKVYDIKFRRKFGPLLFMHKNL